MPRTLPALTSLRFFAALYVVGFHLVAFEDGWPGWMRSLHDSVLVEGHAGVAFFFLLSGFILAWNYADRMRGGGLRGHRAFFVARAARIVPVHLASFAVAGIALLVLGRLGEHPTASVFGLVLNPLLLHAWVPAESVFHGYNAVSWSLSVEAAFYLAFPTVLALSIAITRSTGPCGRVLTMVAVWASGAAFTAIMATVASRDVATWSASVLPVGVLYLFVLGVVLALTLRESYVGLAAAAARRPGLMTGLELATLGVLLVQILVHDTVPLAYRYGIWYAPAVAALIATQAIGGGAIANLLTFRPLQHLGEISYSLYMWHYLVLMAVVATGVFAAHGLIGSAVVVAVSLVVSHLSFTRLETPARLWVRARTHVLREPHASVGPAATELAARS